MLNLFVSAMFLFSGGVSNEVVYEDEYVTMQYVVTEVEGNEYLGDRIDVVDGTGIFFDDTLVDDDIQVGDTVVAVFDSENIDDGLLAVEKVKY